jgi:AcrR family transcriptional regulator
MGRASHPAAPGPSRRLAPDRRREAIVDAALAVALRKGLAATTVRDIAAEMGTSSGLVHHYFASMDDVLAAAFEQAAARDLEASAAAMRDAPDPAAALRAFFRTYAPVDGDWAFQLWLDAWAEAARRPALRETSRRLNLAWVALLQGTVEAGVAGRAFRCPDPRGAAWRIVSLIDGLALQLVAHPSTLGRDEVIGWATAAAERELGLAPGALSPGRDRRPGR